MGRPAARALLEGGQRGAGDELEVLPGRLGLFTPCDGAYAMPIEPNEADVADVGGLLVGKEDCRAARRKARA